ncbi:hypothetical protein B2A_14268, partial [mine drainage metagenome]
LERARRSAQERSLEICLAPYDGQSAPLLLLPMGASASCPFGEYEVSETTKEAEMPATMFSEDDVISRYTRAQAIEDGVLVEVSELAREAGFRFPWHDA